MRSFIKTKKIIQVICYILKKFDCVDKLKLIKLIYLVDKYHVAHYGRTVTKDDYVAMKCGPVASTVKDILNLDDVSLLSNEFDYANMYIEKASNYDYKIKNQDIEFDMLSETDTEAIDLVLARFGDKTQFDLVEYTHRYPEWYQYEELFKQNPNTRGNIRTFELINFIQDDPIIEGLNEEHVEQSKLMVMGCFE